MSATDTVSQRRAALVAKVIAWQDDEDYTYEELAAAHGWPEPDLLYRYVTISGDFVNGEIWWGWNLRTYHSRERAVRDLTQYMMDQNGDRREIPFALIDTAAGRWYRAEPTVTLEEQP